MGNWGHCEPRASPSREKRPKCGRRMPARAKKLLSAGVPPRVPTAAGSGPFCLSREEVRVREVHSLPSPHPTPDPRSRPSWLLWPSPARARGRPGRKLSDGSAAGAAAETRPGRLEDPPGNAEPEGAMSVTGAGAGVAQSAGAPESRLCLN